MAPQDWLIVALAIIDVVFVIMLLVVALRFKATAEHVRRIVTPLIDRGRRIAGTGQQLVGTTKSRSEAMLHIVQTLASHVSARVTTTRRIVAEVAHPDTSTRDTLARTLDQGREWSQRLNRLRAAAQRAAGSNGHRNGQIDKVTR